MEYAGVIFNQLITMAIYVAIGYLMHRLHFITKDGIRAFSNFLLYVILPCVIISSFCKKTTVEMTRSLLQSLWLGLLLLLLAMSISRVCFPRNPVHNFSASFSNAGFMGIPLIAAAISNEAVFYVAAMTAFLNIFQWTYGQRLLSQEKSPVRWKQIICNPLVIAFLIGILLYFLPVSLPAQIDTCIRSIAACNSPVAMIILGYYLSEIPFRRIFMQANAYPVCALRLLSYRS